MMKRIHAVKILAGKIMATAMLTACSSSTTSNLIVVETMQYTEGLVADGERKNSLFLDLYRPAPDILTAPLCPGIIAMHGGSFVGGARDIQEQIDYGMHFAERGFIFASISYRLQRDSPKISSQFQSLAKVAANACNPIMRELHTQHGEAWPNAAAAASEDLVKALAWMHDNAESLHIDPERIIILGASAGAIAANNIAYLADEFGIEHAPIRAVVSIRGLLPDMCESSNSNQLIRNEDPPIFIIHGVNDTRVYPEEATRFFWLAKNANIPTEIFLIPGYGHDLGGAKMLNYKLETGEYIKEKLDFFLKKEVGPTCIPLEVNSVQE